MNRAGSPATNDPQSRRLPWRLVYGEGGARPDPSAAVEPLDGATNMAIDQALLDAVKAGAAPVLRLYRWSPPTLSFGRNQPTRDRYDAAQAAAHGIDFVRRPTGGQAVLHDDELTYAVIAPIAVIGKPRAAYGRINRALVDGLGRLGVRAALAGDGGLGRGAGAGGGAGPDWDAACFRRPERGEVVVGGAKLVGSAQRMEDRTILQHGSILVGGSQAAAEELLLASRRVEANPGPTTSPTTKSRTDTGWTTLERELGSRPGWAELAAAVRAGFVDVLGIELEEATLTDEEASAAESLRIHFASDEWTWRR